MRCGFVKRATWLLGLLVPAAMAADYYIKATYDNNRATYIAVETTRGTQCRNIQNGLAFSTDDITQEDFAIYKSSPCQERNLIATISGAELYAESDSAIINIDRNGNWNFTNKPKDDPEEGPKDDPKDPEDPRDPGQDDPKDPEDPGKDTPKNGLKFIAFFTPWTNTNAKVFLSNGDSAAMVPVEEKYCGWFIAGVKAPNDNFGVYFKQTIGPNFVGAEGLTKTEPTSATEISLDSVAALSDTIWVKGNQEGAPGIYSEHPAGVLGDCPIKKLPVMMFDWLHGSKGDGTRGNGSPEYGISADFGSGGCSGNPMRGMVATELGPNGVPVSAANFPTNCKITEHLDYWFIPESLAVDAQGNTLTNMTCRDLYISMDDEGFWLAEVSKDAISKGNEANQGGMFLLDDFQYLDSAQKVPNPYYDQLRGGSDNRNHNFGFTMKIQATFEYVPGQYFDFLGDDDVWVFINNKLVVDIGGQHAQVAGAVDLDTLGLIPDSTYNFHIFYAERHTSSSNFRMHTSIDLKTEASILLRSPSSNSDVIEREIYQRIRKSKLACDFSEAGKELTLERGASTFTLFGGNLPSTGIELDSAGLWFGGIDIGKNFDAFKVDKEAIKDAHGLAPGVYYLRVSLVADNSQHKDVYFVVGAYELPNLTFTDPKGNMLGAEIVSDTLQLNLTKDVTMWVGQSYKVYVQYADQWAMNSNDKIYPSTNDPALIPCDSLGNPITEVQLVNGKATFYVKAVGELWGGTLYVKGQASGNTAIWSAINFALPPVPQIQTAYMFDRDGDGRGDSIWVHFNGTLGGKNSLDSVKFTFGSVFDKAYTANYDVGDSVATIVADGNGFGTSIFTGGEEKVYTGQLKVWYTYKDNGKTSVFPTEGQLEDRIGPVIMAAEVSYMKDGNTQLTISFSEALQSNNASSDMFSFHVWKNGIMSTNVKQASDISTSSATQWKLIFPKGADTDIIPAVGDSVRFSPTSAISSALDLVNNKPHQDNPWVRITGEQKVTITSPGVVTLEPGSAVFDSAKAIIQSPEATVTKIIQDPSILTAEQAAAAYGTQGHFLGDLNMAELVENEIADIVRAVQSTPSYVNKDEAKEAEKNGTTPRSYTIEEIIAMVDNGDMSIKEAKKKFGIDPVIAEAYENGILDSRNIDKFQRGTEADIKQIVEAVAENTELRYKATYYSSLGEFVNSNSDVITCNSDIFKENGQGTCLDNNGKLFLAWNMRAKNGRLASTGVYIARLEYRIKVGSKTVVDRTQDFLWGVRRGKVNALDFGL
ncbi:fibro-slime domain-containing protein [Fibrobacter sp.]|uniref:fibro-slime domain-containing protein n=1 Tax=Fibrobacter sp. TaxID=35828 RepID=UPI00388FCA0D